MKNNLNNKKMIGYIKGNNVRNLRLFYLGKITTTQGMGMNYYNSHHSAHTVDNMCP